jgi:hypothetical protein
MIEKTLKTTTGKLRVQIPDQLNEVTLGQMMELQEKPGLNDIEAISILSGIPVEALNNVSDVACFQEFGDTVLSLSYQIKYLYKSDAIPKKVSFSFGKGGTTVNFISNLSVEPAGAFMAARDIIADEISEHIKTYGEDDLEACFNPSLKACCQVLAHYFYCRATGKKYNEYEAEEFCNEVKKLRVTEALPIAKHFFSCYPTLSGQRTNFFHRLLQSWKKRRAYNHLKNSNISTQ